MLTDGRTTDGRTTDARVTGILIAHLGAFGSGELIKIDGLNFYLFPVLLFPVPLEVHNTFHILLETIDRD